MCTVQMHLPSQGYTQPSQGVCGAATQVMALLEFSSTQAVLVVY